MIRNFIFTPLYMHALNSFTRLYMDALNTLTLTFVMRVKWLRCRTLLRMFKVQTLHFTIYHPHDGPGVERPEMQFTFFFLFTLHGCIIKPTLEGA